MKRKVSKADASWLKFAKKVSNDPKQYTFETIELVAKIRLYLAEYGDKGMSGLLFMMREL